MQWVGWRRLKFSEMEVELACPLALRMNEQRANPDLVAGRRHSLERVLDKRGAEAASLVLNVHPEASEEHDGNWVPARSSPNPIGTHFVLNRSRGEGVVPNHAPSPGQADYVNAAGSRLLCLEGVSPKPVSLSWRSAVEGFRLVIGGENLNGCESLTPHRVGWEPQGAGAGAAVIAAARPRA